MSSAIPPSLVDFYEVPFSRLDELQRLAKPASHGAKDSLLSMLEILDRPIPSHQDEGDYLGAVLGYLNERKIVETERRGRYGDLMLDLVETVGGSWDLLEPRPAVIAALEPRSFAPDDFRASYEQVEDAAGEDAGPAMVKSVQLLRDALSGCSDDSFLLIRTS